MAKDDDIIDLTEIIQESPKFPKNQVANNQASPSIQQGMRQGASKQSINTQAKRIVDPNEKLQMPGIDDIDKHFDKLGITSPPIQTKKPDTSTE